MVPHRQMLIDGQWCDADNGRRFEVDNPATEEIIATVAYGGRTETRRALEAAQKAMPGWMKQTAYDRAKILKKTADLMRERADLIAQQSVMAPSTTIGGSAITTSLTAEDVRRRYDSNLQALTAQRYGRSVVDGATVCVLNESAAIVSGRFTRYRTDGSVLAEIASTYVFAKSDGRWRIVTQMAHGRDRQIACN